jgi:hypothetical protein
MLIKDTPRQAETFPYHSSNSATPGSRPMLTIEYTAIPEPMTMTLLGMGVVGLISRRRRK